MSPVSSASAAGSRRATAYQAQPTRHLISRRPQTLNPGLPSARAMTITAAASGPIGRNSICGISPAAKRGQDDQEIEKARTKNAGRR
ncbi:hypothetical protein [Arthrobacter sp. UYCu712]|uniref:hypothetical protein n=1 Tax=Arthrobacter sp. UYCu712 TaxID=3156340 RepID=UPI003395CF8D